MEMGMTATYTEFPAMNTLRNEVIRHALLHGWVAPLLVLWVIGTGLFLFYWQLPLLALVWSLAATLIGGTMVRNELQDDEIARASLQATLERDLAVEDLGNKQHIEDLTSHIKAFAEIAVRIHAIGPGCINDRYLTKGLKNMYEVLAVESEAAHNVELTWELELSPEICQEFRTAWHEVSNRSIQGANPGPRFAMDFARSTLEMVPRVRLALSAAEKGTTSAVDKASAEVTPAPASTADKELVRMTATALRRLGKPASLARCGLLERLPHTLAAAWDAVQTEQAPGEGMTPLDQVQMLRASLIAAIEKLSSGESHGRGEPEALQYLILNEEYVLHRPVKAIVTRHSIGEGVFYRNRREGIRALSAELAAHEAILARRTEAVV
jgi:hypothetical protein